MCGRLSQAIASNPFHTAPETRDPPQRNLPGFISHWVQRPEKFPFKSQFGHSDGEWASPFVFIYVVVLSHYTERLGATSLVTSNDARQGCTCTLARLQAVDIIIIVVVVAVAVGRHEQTHGRNGHTPICPVRGRSTQSSCRWRLLGAGVIV